MNEANEKPILLQSGIEQVKTLAGEDAANILMASGSDWVKAISQGRLPRKKSGHSL